MRQILYKHWFFAVALLLGMMPIVYFSWYTEASTSLTRDQWHYLTMLTAYYDGSLSFGDLFMRHGEHLQLGYNLWFLINGLYFGLDTKLELWLGISFLCCAMVVLYREYARSVSQVASHLSVQVSFILFLLVLLSLNQEASFGYSLLAFGAFGNMLLMMLTLSVFDRMLLADKVRVGDVVSFIGLFLMLGVLLAGGAWVIYVLAMLIVLFCWVIVQKPAKKKVLMFFAIGAFLGIILFCIHYIGVSERSVQFATFAYISENSWQAFKYVLLLFANTLLDINDMHKEGLVGLSYIVGLVVLSLFLASLYVFFRVKMWKRTYIPVYIWVYMFLIIIALLASRFPLFGVSNAASPRYVTTLQLGIISSVWIYSYAIFQMDATNFRKSSLWMLMAASLVSLYAVHFSIQYERLPYVKKAQLSMADLVGHELFDKKTIACPHPDLCMEGINTLKEHKLNVFAEEL